VASLFATLTRWDLKAGRNFDTGSVSSTVPSSISIIVATDTSGLVIE
jgi:hypothetical protein